MKTALEQKDTLAPTGLALTRRQVISRALGAAGVAALGTSTLLAGCAAGLNRSQVPISFDAADIAWLDEVAETILPATDTPGAKAAQVGAFIAIMVADTYSPEEQQLFRRGMQRLEAECRQQHGQGILEATPAQRLELLQRLDQERYDFEQNAPASGEPHYFGALRQLTLFGYFTSEIGYTQALRYVETPGRYDPCLDWQPGDKSWAPHA